MAASRQWQEQIEQVSAELNSQYLDVLLDQTSLNSCAIAAMKILKPEIPWFSLFNATPEENSTEHAPLLMRLDLAHWKHKAWLEEMMSHCATDARLLVLFSPLTFEALSRSLQALMQIRWGGQDGLLRYYDPRIFPVLMKSILTDDQRAEYLRVAIYWSWLDRDEQPQWLQGGGQTPTEGMQIGSPMDLSDQQCDSIGAISDAQRLLVDHAFDALGPTQESRFAKLHAAVMQASEENYFGNLANYVRRKS